MGQTTVIITSIYAFIGISWIFFSDKLLNMLVKDQNVIFEISVIKGVFYVVFTAALLFALIFRSFVKLQTAKNELKKGNDLLYKEQASLKLADERYKLVIQGSNDCLWDWDIANDNIAISPEWLEMLGLDKQDINIALWSKLIYQEDLPAFTRKLEKQLNDIYSENFKHDYRLRMRNGNYIWIYSRGKILRSSDGRAIRIAGSHTDITERMNIQTRYERLAYYDDLTNLPNASMFAYHLNMEIGKTAQADKKFAVLCLDLYNLKSINDTLGHRCGDAFIKKAAEELQKTLYDNVLISRFGGGNFSILLKSVHDTKQIRDYAESIIQKLKIPLIIEGKYIFPTFSIGIAVYPDDGHEADVLLRNSDMAMRKAKEIRDNAYRFFEQSFYQVLFEKATIEKQLRLAVLNEEFVLYYQPQAYIENKKVSGFEALIRWTNPDRGTISPLEFIPLAEETGLIRDIGYWVFRTACRQSKIIETELGDDIAVSINLSAIQLQDENFIQMIKKIIEDEDIRPEKIIFEITESAIIKNLEINRKILLELRKLGIKISLDDFGTGYSSLSYLNQIPINEVKIDKSFINNLMTDHHKMVIVDTIIELSHRLGFEVTAEGVEVADEFRYLKEHGCDKIQGYLLSKPQKLEDIIKRGINCFDVQAV